MNYNDDHGNYAISNNHNGFYIYLNIGAENSVAKAQIGFQDFGQKLNLSVETWLVLSTGILSSTGCNSTVIA